MTENERREREAFEAWARLENHDLRRWPAPDGTYADSLTGFMWDAWKARASLSASTPSEQDGWIRVDEVHAIIQQARESICAGGLAENAQHERSVVEPYLDGISDELDELSRASAPSAEARETCLWSRNTDDDSGMYETTCRNAFQFNDGGLADNNVKFCLYCGKPAEEDLHSDDDAAMAPPADNKENGNG